MNLENTQGDSIPVNHGRNPDDDKIRLAIYKKLGEESGVDIHVRDGVVRLTGEVDHNVMLEAAESSVNEIKGVARVINELRVKPFNS